MASASFYPSPAPTRPELVSYQLRFMAVDADNKATGMADGYWAPRKTRCAPSGVEQLWANARDTALGFYQSRGGTYRGEFGPPERRHQSSAPPDHKILLKTR